MTYVGDEILIYGNLMISFKINLYSNLSSIVVIMNSNIRVL